ncbi:hypothetical protein B1F79_01240 [Coxiella-like endosymbiont of Rhipicephalus sanguineus]|uniref:VOC family protein n=1 Tax=Coxiella-like endosymbiont of Rhipicephalus sanguineus TaxID=1955402 RepID=UPI002040F2DD|nr:hypothetical protein [Coxiella-like endosymbiont of Rhipicephalus sanguineus]MBT8506336.1 hypothetical protein [Coxiella-like endosymbiont of Rhipicephalus sanguineus]
MLNKKRIWDYSSPLGNGSVIFIYQKENHQPVIYTVLNFEVDDIDQVVYLLNKKGIHFEQYTGELQTDKKGIFRSNSKKKYLNIV